MALLSSVLALSASGDMGMRTDRPFPKMARH